MKAISIAAAGLAVALIALTLVPAAADFRPYFAAGSLVAAIAVVVTVLVGWRDSAASSFSQRTGSNGASAAAPVEADVVGLLAMLQEHGRFVDFLQDDITSYSDAQVGAAARIVHQGCKSVLNQYFRIVPVRAENEGAKITVAPGYAADEYRFVGKLSGAAPFSGTLVHRGWKTESVELPRVVSARAGRLPTIAPAEVELR